ncbi:7-cyano-7-deazaguanine synthase [Roseibium algicola]
MSGGLDSSACAHFLSKQGVQVRGLFINYGQAALQAETAASRAMADFLSIPIDVCEVSNGQLFGAGELIGRNAMLIFSALFLSRGCSDLLALGLHAGTPYYDCSDRFINSASHLVSEITDNRTVLATPFLTWTKQEVVSYFCEAGLPTELSYSCELGLSPVCGRCASCLDREALLC